MKIFPFRNTVLNLEVRLFTSPRMGKLKKELTDFFAANPIEGSTVSEFRIEGNNIIPENPYLEGVLSGRENYNERINEIGRKYGIDNLGFVHWCYHK